MRVHHALLLATLGLVGCGGGSDAPIAVASVVITPSTAVTTFTPGAKLDLTAVAKDASGATMTTKTPTWSTSNAAVVSISTAASGAETVTGVGTGTAQVTATSDGKTASVSFTVVAAAFTQTTVSPLSKQLAPAATQQLTATAVDQNGVAMTGFNAATFSSSNTAVATVSSSGLVTAVANGTANITASITGGGVTKTAIAAITVAAGGGFPQSAVVGADGIFAWNPNSVDIVVGGTVTFSNQTIYDHNVTYASTNGAPANIPTFVGESKTSTFNTAGTFNYNCSIHPGMTGKVIVH